VSGTRVISEDSLELELLRRIPLEVVQVAVSIPERQCDVNGKLLVGSVLAQSAEPARSEGAANVAAAGGRRIGEEIRGELSLRPSGTGRVLTIAADTLRDRGNEPYPAEDGRLRLRSCPFHAIARHVPQLVCGMTQAFIDGILRGIGNQSLEAALESTPGLCCVVLRDRREAASVAGREHPALPEPGRPQTTKSG
jgi:predicted ArsR family transcriptional regulator